MKKIVLIILMAFTVSLIVAQSPCCKNKAPGIKCSKIAHVENENKITDGSVGLSTCCKNKQVTDASSCSTKQWWQVWKKGCDKPCCAKG